MTRNWGRSGKFNSFTCSLLWSLSTLFLCGCPQDSLPKLNSKSVSPSPSSNLINNLFVTTTPKKTATQTPTATVTPEEVLTYYKPFGDVSRYNQNSTFIQSSYFPEKKPEKSALCAPTAAAMALRALIGKAGTSSLIKDSWTLKTFLTSSDLESLTNTADEATEARRQARHIEVMADLMKTDIEDGTIYLQSSTRPSTSRPDIVLGVHDRKSDFSENKMIGVFTKENISTTIHDFTDNLDGNSCCGLKKGFANVVIVGHYVAEKTRILGQDFVTFKAFGGHAMTVTGYTVDSTGATELIINNPTGGQLNFEPVDQLILNGSISINNKNYLIKVLPDGAKTQGYFSGYNYKTTSVTIDGKTYNSEPVFEIIEAYTGLSASL